MLDMLTLQSTDVRREWSSVLDSVIRSKPAFIRRTRDTMFLSDLKVLDALLSAYSFTADRYTEEDGSVTLALREIDLTENASDEQTAKQRMAQAILEYAGDFYQEFSVWSSAPNRKAHIPYVFKALAAPDIAALEDMIQCQAGES
ncbi:MAG: hypothetical protein FWG31_09910 [Oscillospiraceae bacterium]|nr:hypothetical protein [Oscillospiraceae bacterium]